MTNILVTGGAGFIGSCVCEKLIEQGHSIVCIDNFNNYYNPKYKENNIKNFKESKNFKLYRKDITDFKDLKMIFDENKIEKVIHLAARAGVRASMDNPQLYADVNIKGTINVLECIKENNVRNKNKITKLIFASSSSVYGSNKKIPFSENDSVNNLMSPYAATKIAGELICKTYNHLYKIPVICLRFFTVYGPRNRPDMAVYKFTKAISDGKEISIFGDGESSRDYTYVEDIVGGIILSLNKDVTFEIINLGNSNPIKLKDLIKTIEKNIGKKAKINKLPSQKGDVELTYANISKAKKILGYHPKTNIQRGIHQFTKWFNENK